MDQIKLPNAWVIPGIVLPTVQLPENPTAFKDLILEHIELRYQVSISMMRKKDRRGEIAYPRQLLCFLIRECYKDKAPLVWIANLLNYRDHTSIMYSIQSFEAMLETNSSIYHKLLPLIQGQQFTTVREDYNHFKFLIYKCLHPEIISSVSQDTLGPVKTPLQS